MAKLATAPKLDAQRPDDRVAATPDAEPHRGPATPVGVMRAEISAEQQVLFDRLRTWRRQKAHEEGAPPHVILTNRQLAELVRQRPRSNGALADIQGLGDNRIARHGQEPLAALWPDAPRYAPSGSQSVNW
ncbi:MAG: HRDC domain-containing protein [Planctomycetes bacterium]|nr:HRDC domain-containing protein [Planctomycetota bacterium]